MNWSIIKEWYVLTRTVDINGSSEYVEDYGSKKNCYCRSQNELCDRTAFNVVHKDLYFIYYEFSWNDYARTDVKQ